MTDADLTRRARDEAERRWPAWRTLRPGELMRNSDAEWVQLGFIAGAEWAVSELPIPADDDAPCPRCGCPTACPEGRMEALSAELAEAKAEACRESDRADQWMRAHDSDLAEAEAERDALAARLDALRAECEDQRSARKVAADAADRFRDVLAECLSHDDNNPGDDVLVAEIRTHFGKTGPEPTRWRDFLTGALARLDQINAMPDPRALLGGDEREGGE